MWRTSLMVVCSLLGWTAAFAQEPVTSISVLTTDRQPVISVSNANSLPIEAFLITVDMEGTKRDLTRIYYDVHTNFRHDVAIAPGASTQVALPHIVERPLPVPELRAVVFSDGSTSGEAIWVAELLRRRAIVAERLKEVTGLLDQISSQNLTRDDAIALLQGAREARQKGTSTAPVEERVLQDWVFVIAIDNIGRDLPVGGKVPEPRMVARVLGNRFAAWLLDLRIAGPPQGI
jgi:hypothetical protein